MSVNLMDMMKGYMTDAVMGKASEFLGENAGATQKAMGAILPALLGGAANQAASPSGAARLFDLLKSGGHDGSILSGGLGSLLGGGSATQGLLSSGGGIVSSLFGDKVGGIVGWLAQFAGIKNGSANSLMSMAAPLVMGLIGKQVGGGGLSGLTSLLGSQASALTGAIPSGLAGLAGLTNFSAPSAPKMPVSTESGSTNWLPWALLAGLAAVGFWAFRSCKTETAAPVPPKIEKVTTPVVAAPDTVAKTIKLADGQEIKAKTGSFLDLLYKELASKESSVGKVLTFDNVNFATSSAVITADSRGQLDDLAKVMKAFPNCAIRVEGHTDNVGNEASNLKLSESRAASVKAFLQKDGISGERVATAGFGSKKPVADNKDEAGRAKNRRIEAIITKE
ncbi:MAG: hypothetical protein RL757_935 [Bacteroidota bacterium]